MFLVRPFISVLQSLSTLADKPSDSDAVKLQHSLLIYIGLTMSLGGVLWGSIACLSGFPMQSLIPYGYTLATLLNFTYLYLSKNFKVVLFIQILLSLLLPFLFQLSLGGFIPSGGVVLWSILTILISFNFQTRRASYLWFLLYLLLVIISGLADSSVQNFDIHVPKQVSILFFTMNIIVISSIIFALLNHFSSCEHKMRQALNDKANCDDLTGIANRRHFFYLAEKEFSRCRRYHNHLSLMMIDLDYFKKINDTFGHTTGDAILKAFTNLLQQHLRQADLLGRYGGEEFVVLLPQTPKEEAAKLAQRIIEKTHLITLKEHENISVTVSIGITHYHIDDEKLEELINRADRALYQAKNSGRDQLQIVTD